MDEKEYNVFTLENGTEYTEIHRLEDDGKTYVVLSDLENPKDFCVRKLIKENGEDYVIKLDGEEEFNRVLAKFQKEFLS